MAKMGFIRDETPAKGDSALKNVERDFQAMIRGVELERDFLKQEMKIDKRIRKELVKIYKRIKVIEKKINQRNKLKVLCNSYSLDNPKRALEIIPQVEELDQSIKQEVDILYAEISKYYLRDVKELERDLQIDEQQRKQLRIFSNSLHQTLGIMFAPVSYALEHKEMQELKKSILERNPLLR